LQIGRVARWRHGLPVMGKLSSTVVPAVPVQG
jgi:hypothetical protein